MKAATFFALDMSHPNSVRTANRINVMEGLLHFLEGAEEDNNNREDKKATD